MNVSVTIFQNNIEKMICIPLNKDEIGILDRHRILFLDLQKLTKDEKMMNLAPIFNYLD